MEITQWEHKLLQGKSELMELEKKGWESVGLTSNNCLLLKRPCGTVDINVKEPSNNNTQLLEKLLECNNNNTKLLEKMGEVLISIKDMLVPIQQEQKNNDVASQPISNWIEFQEKMKGKPVNTWTKEELELGCALEKANISNETGYIGY